MEKMFEANALGNSNPPPPPGFDPLNVVYMYTVLWYENWKRMP